MITISAFGFLTSVLFEIVTVFLFSLSFNVVKGSIRKLYTISIRSSDFYPIILSIYIYELSVNKHGISFLPYILLVLFIILLVYGVYYVFNRDNAKVGIFYKISWRFSVIFIFVGWASTIIVCAAKTL